MNIVLVGRYSGGRIRTGPEKVAANIFAELSSGTDTVTFVEYFFSGAHYGIVRKLFGHKTVHAQGSGIVLRLGILPFIFFLMKHRNTLIHIVTFERFAILAILLKRLLGLHVLYTVNGIVQHEERLFRKDTPRFLRWKDAIAERLLMEQSDRVFFLSEESRVLAAQYYRIPGAGVHVTANGIDAVFHTALGSRRAAANDAVDIVFVGDVDRAEKGFEFLLRSLAHTSGSYRLHVVSNPSPRFDAILRSVDHVVVQKMPTEKFAGWLADKDVFVSASSYEPFSLAAVEAMAAGLVPVVTRQTGMARFIVHGINGFVVEHGDDRGLSEILSHLCHDRNLAQTLGTASASLYSILTWSNIAAEYRLAYDQITAGDALRKTP